MKDNLRTMRPNSNSYANPRRKVFEMYGQTITRVRRRILLIPRRRLAMFPDTIPHKSTKLLFVGFLRAIDWPESTYPRYPCTLLNNNLACIDECVYDAELNSIPRRASRCFHTRSFLSSFQGEGGRVSHTHIHT